MCRYHSHAVQTPEEAIQISFQNNPASGNWLWRQSAFALPPKEDTDTEAINNGITLETTTECANPSERNGPQSADCPNEDFETVTECEATNRGGGSPAGHEKDCPEGT